MKEKTSEEVLDDFSLEVKKIEADAAKIIEDANLKRDELIAQSKTEAVSSLTKKQQQLEKIKEDKIQKSKVKIDEKRDENLKEGKKELKTFEAKARKNIPKAVDFVIKKLNSKIEEI